MWDRGDWGTEGILSKFLPFINGDAREVIIFLPDNR